MDMWLHWIFASFIVVYICMVVLNVILAATALIYCILVLMGNQGRWRKRAYMVLYPLVWPVLLMDVIMLLSTIL